MRKGAQQAAAIVAASRTGRCLRTTVVLEQDGRAPANLNLSTAQRIRAPRPPARAIQARLCQSDSEVKKKFPQSKKAGKHESVVVGLIF